MIRVSVLYPRDDNSRFDTTYYISQHVPLVKKLLKPSRIEVENGIPDKDGTLSPFFAIGLLEFDSMQQMVEGYSNYGKQLHNDITNYTNVAPIFQINEVIKI